MLLLLELQYLSGQLSSCWSDLEGFGDRIHVLHTVEQALSGPVWLQVRAILVGVDGL